MSSEGGHRVGLIALHVLAVVLYVAELVLSSLSGSGSSSIFNSTQTNLSELFFLEITPSSWTFSIWGFIFAWQAVWLVYSVTLLFRRGKAGRLYVNPGLFTTGFLVSFCLSCAGVITWLFVFDRQYISVALAALLFTAVALHVTQAFGYWKLNKVETTRMDQCLRVDVWLMRILTLNGLAFYTTWVSIASCLNIAMVMAYAGPSPLTMPAACSAALATLMVVVFFWFILKTFVFEKQLRFILSPFIVLFLALAGSIDKNWNPENSNSIFTAALLTLVCVLFLITLVSLIVRQWSDNKRQKTQPIDSESGADLKHSWT